MKSHVPHTAVDCFPMRKLLYLTFSMALIAALTTYAMWAADRPVGHYLSDLRINLAVDQARRPIAATCWASSPSCFPLITRAPSACTASSRPICKKPGTRAC